MAPWFKTYVRKCGMRFRSRPPDGQSTMNVQDVVTLIAALVPLVVAVTGLVRALSLPNPSLTDASQSAHEVEHVAVR
jgi:hypothetical protein